MKSARMGWRRTGSGNRTRTLFFGFIAVMLALIAFSLNAQIIDSDVLMQIYIATSILAVGVIIIDMMGLLGSQHGDEGGIQDADGGGHDGAHGGGDHGHIDADGGGSMDLDYAGGDDAYGADDDYDHAPLHEIDHDSTEISSGPVLEAIRYLRMFVYFCLGFGPIGLALLASGRTAQASLVFASLAGVGTVLLARTFYRFQPRDTGEVLSDNDLLLELGTVIVPLDHTNMGKVRVQLGMQVHEPYALSAHEEEQFVRGDRVRVIQVREDCVYVEGV